MFSKAASLKREKRDGEQVAPLWGLSTKDELRGAVVCLLTSSHKTRRPSYGSSLRFRDEEEMAEKTATVHLTGEPLTLSALLLPAN